MSQPAILYRNVLEIAQDGRGDGTIYAYGTGATPSATAKTFDCTAGYTIISERGADADEKWLGYELVFTASGRSYLVTDWVASTDLATVYETPNAEDTGAWTMRRTLHTDDFDVAYPVRNTVNGRLYDYWKDRHANSVVGLWACLPNAIDDAGFELNLALDGTNPYWTREVAGTGTVAINATTPILGTYDCKLNLGDQTYVGLYQAGKIELKAGYTHGIILKAGGDGGTVTDLRVFISYVAYGDVIEVPVTFTKTAAGSGDTLANGGNGTNNVWKPSISNANAWEEVTFTVPQDLDASAWQLHIRQYDSTDVFIDEIYVWQIGPTIDGGAADQADTVIMGGHNFAGGFDEPSRIRGQRIQGDLTGLAAGDLSTASNDAETVIDLDANVQVDGNAPVYTTFTAFPELVPIYEILIGDAGAAKWWQAAELWIGKLWTWEKYPEEPITNKLRTIESQSASARGGATRSEKLYQSVTVTGRQDLISSTEIDIWLDFLEYSGHGKPFWLRVQANTALGVTASTQFMRCVSPPDLRPDPPTYYAASFKFEEAK